MEKFSRGGEAIDDNMVDANFILDTKCYTHTYSENVILIAFPLQYWWHERTSLLRHTYIACLVFSKPENHVRVPFLCQPAGLSVLFKLDISATITILSVRLLSVQRP